MNEIVTAIKQRNILELRYHGLTRLVEPHAYGINQKGHRVLLCYQTSGGSQSNEPQGWKLLLESEIVSLHQTGQNFSMPRAGYKRNDAAMKTILAQL